MSVFKKRCNCLANTLIFNSQKQFQTKIIKNLTPGHVERNRDFINMRYFCNSSKDIILTASQKSQPTIIQPITPANSLTCLFIKINCFQIIRHLSDYKVTHIRSQIPKGINKLVHAIIHLILYAFITKIFKLFSLYQIHTQTSKYIIARLQSTSANWKYKNHSNWTLKSKN